MSEFPANRSNRFAPQNLLTSKEFEEFQHLIGIKDRNYSQSLRLNALKNILTSRRKKLLENSIEIK